MAQGAALRPPGRQWKLNPDLITKKNVVSNLGKTYRPLDKWSHLDPGGKSLFFRFLSTTCTSWMGAQAKLACYGWFSPDFIPVMLVHRTKEQNVFCKTWATICCCFVHQHGCLITWLKSTYLYSILFPPINLMVKLMVKLMVGRQRTSARKLQSCHFLHSWSLNNGNYTLFISQDTRFFVNNLVDHEIHPQQIQLLAIAGLELGKSEMNAQRSSSSAVLLLHT